MLENVIHLLQYTAAWLFILHPFILMAAMALKDEALYHQRPKAPPTSEGV